MQRPPLEDQFVQTLDSVLNLTSRKEVNFDNLLTKYANQGISIETGEQGRWKVTLYWKLLRVVIGVDVNVNKLGFPQARVLEPKFEESEQLLWNGIIVANNLTFSSWSGYDFIASILDVFSKEHIAIARRYESLAIESGFKRISKPSHSYFSPIWLDCSSSAEAKADEIILSDYLKTFIMSRIEESTVDFLAKEPRYFEIETKSGLKMIASLSDKVHKQSNKKVLLSPALMRNLKCERKEICLRLVSVPIAKQIEIWLPGSAVVDSPTRKRIKTLLSTYGSFTAGTILPFDKKDFEQEIAILDVKAWNSFPGLTLDAVSTKPVTDTPVDMLIVYSNKRSETPYRDITMSSLQRLAEL
jgi:hypothetical protein